MNVPQRSLARVPLPNGGAREMKSSLLSSDSLKKTFLKNYKGKKILIMGYNETGKSSIVLKFLYDTPDASSLGPEESYYTSLKYEEENFLLNIVDFAGIDEYTPIYANKHGLKVDGYILVYSVENRRSFDFVQQLREKLRALNGKDVPAVLVANKCDIKDTRQVSTEEGKRLSKALGIPYLEVSAKRHSTDVIRKVFQVMLREIITSENQVDVLKRLKNWDESKVRELYSLFMFGTVLLALIGIFLEAFGMLNILLYPKLIATQGVVLVLLIVNGLILITAAILGHCGMRKKEQDCITLFAILAILSVILGVVSIAFKAIDEQPNEGGLVIASPGAFGGEFNSLGSLVYVMIGISFFLLTFAFVVSCLSKEIFIKKKPYSNNRYISLAV